MNRVWLIVLSLITFSAASQSVEEIKALSDSLYQTGQKHFIKGEFSLSKKDFFKCLELRKTIYKPKDAEYEDVIFSICALFREAGNNETANRILSNDLEIVLRYWGKNSLKYARSVELQGLLTLEIDDFETAENHLRLANSIYSKSSEKSSEAYARNLVYEAQLYMAQGQYTATEALLRKSRFLFKTLPINSWAYSEMLLTTGELYEHLHNYQEAIEEFNELLDLNTKVYGNMHPFISKAHFNLAKIYLESDYPANSKPHAIAAYDGFVKYYGRNHLKTLLAKALLADYYIKTKQYSRADSIYKQTLESLDNQSEEKHVINAKVESGLASLYYNTGKYSDAINLHQQSLEVIKEFLENSHPFYVKTINELSFLYWASKKRQLSENFFAQSTVNYINQFNRYFAFLSEQEKGFLYHDIRLFFDKYNAYILTQVNQKPALARVMYNNQLTTKALLFHTSQEIRKQVMLSGDPNLQKKFTSWIDIKGHLSKLYKLVEEDDSRENKDLLDSLEEKANFLEKEISLRIELDKRQKGYSIQEVQWQNIQKSLGKGEAAIEIIRVQDFKPDSGGRFSDKVFYIALILTEKTKKYPAVVVLENGKELETKLLKYYRNCIHHQIPDELSYLNFWQPIKHSKYLNGINKLYISCDGVYNQINLNTILDQESKKAIFDELDIHLLTNTKDILKIKSDTLQKVMGYDLSFFGYPDYYNLNTKNSSIPDKNQHHITLHRTRGSHDFKEIMRGGKIMDLPGTKAEIEEVSSIIREQSIVPNVFLGAEANEQKLKAVIKPTILHVATHGYFMPDLDNQTDGFVSDSMVFQSYSENPLTQSGIMLVGAGNAYTDETLEKELLAVKNNEQFEDGILTAYEAMNINLSNTDLVILSACETGLGEVKNGEGVYGLQRALQTAGAKSVIMSLWKVSDNATKKLMIYFYSEWVKNHDKRVSFRNAQLKLREEYPDPLYWGAFIMIGE